MLSTPWVLEARIFLCFISTYSADSSGIAAMPLQDGRVVESGARLNIEHGSAASQLGTKGVGVRSKPLLDESSADVGMSSQLHDRSAAELTARLQLEERSGTESTASYLLREVVNSLHHGAATPWNHWPSAKFIASAGPVLPFIKQNLTEHISFHPHVDTATLLSTFVGICLYGCVAVLLLAGQGALKKPTHSSFRAGVQPLVASLQSGTLDAVTECLSGLPPGELKKLEKAAGVSDPKVSTSRTGHTNSEI